MQTTATLLSAIKNFLQHTTQKILLINGQVGPDFEVALSELVQSRDQFPLFIDVSQQADIEKILTDIAFDMPVLFVFVNAEIENLYVKYQLNQWTAKAIIICKAMLHPTLDSSVYFAPSDGNRIYRHLFTQVNLAVKRDTKPTATITREREVVPGAKNAAAVSLREHFLNQKLLANDFLQIQLLADRVFDDKNYQAFLFKLIYASRDDEQLQIAAANSATILNHARISFSGLDLFKVKIPNANLESILANQTNFSGANLKNVIFTCGFLAGADFSYSQMEGVQFFEMPQIKLPATRTCVSPNGKYLAACIGTPQSGGVCLTIIDLESYSTHAKIENLPHIVSSFCFSPNNQILAFSAGGFEVIGGGETSIRLWDLKQNAYLSMGPFKGHTSVINSLVFNGDGSLIASASSDDTVRIWQVTTGKCLSAITTHEGTNCAVAFHPSENMLASVSDSGLRFWRVTMQKILELPGLIGESAYSGCVVFSAKGNFVACGGILGIKVWRISLSPDNTIEGRLLWEKHAGQILNLLFSPDETILFSTSRQGDNTVRLWDVKLGEPFADNPVIETGGPINDISIKEEITIKGIKKRILLTCGGRKGVIKQWDLDSNQQRFSAAKQESRKSYFKIAISQDGNHVASSHNGNDIILWRRELNNKLTAFKRLTLERFRTDDGPIFKPPIVEDIAFSPNGELLAAAVYDGTIRFWDVRTGAWLNNKTIMMTTSIGVRKICFSFDGSIIASATGEMIFPRMEVDDTIRLWDVATAKPTTKTFQKLPGHKALVMCTAFNQAMTLLASGSHDGEVRLWQLDVSDSVSLRGGNVPVTMVAFSDDNHWFAFVNEINTIVVLDLTKMKIVADVKLDKFNQKLTGIAFDALGRILVWSTDANVHILNHQTDEYFQLNCGAPINTVLVVGESVLVCNQYADLYCWEKSNNPRNPYLLKWTSRQDYLALDPTCKIQGIEGLSTQNNLLLTQKCQQRIQPTAASYDELVQQPLLSLDKEGRPLINLDLVRLLENARQNERRQSHLPPLPPVGIANALGTPSSSNTLGQTSTDRLLDLFSWLGQRNRGSSINPNNASADPSAPSGSSMRKK